MIVCKRPFVLHDIDLIGLALLALLGLAGWWLIVMPWQQTWADYRALAARRAGAQAGLQQDVAELDRFQQGLARLEQSVTDVTAEAPHAAAVSPLLRQMTDMTQRANLEIDTVLPQPVTRAGDYLVSDIRFVGRGSSHDFIRFLDHLAQANPYQALQSCTMTRPAAGSVPQCELTWSVRLYLLPTRDEAPRGEQS